MRYHWLYRDFLPVIPRHDGEWARTVFEQYIRPHYTLLNTVYFHPKGWLSLPDIMARLQALGPEPFVSIRVLVGEHPETFERDVADIIHDILSQLHYRGPTYDLFVLVGLDSTNIYSLRVNGQPTTVLCLEAAGGERAAIQRLLAHEGHHWARQHECSIGRPESAGERLVAEGLAALFSEEIQPGLDAAAYCYVPPATVTWVTAHWKFLEGLEGQLSDSSLIDALFSRNPKHLLLSDMPPRTGYVYGYLKCREVIARRKGRSALEAVAMPWEQVLG
ncbi:DUF2268 domain-containing putative Zn-dependent protease [Sulfobacillus thermosulfidooxidans]|uniref:DUF2268 domain-containing putative Zn-dependent protease n=1 Tax=Sulfobacillus thermosulfidooxidans TaxID=28034 RepID=UPI00096B955E|nr:DUF2268 domain-containing putative Zn-dependent protease [Sulfobacillus thermosulfidooxidans]OLZ11434.1 hypothetical protein BFX05_07485 [Sulfobacillus thermosulfidooxidans]OLZ12911.1 hypothetical protein BFX06_10075 [Sulfobacillus thermosulfidooxidans]OLZ20910.1 hypothetical protein BFX07_14070 [Sulfobacillus thermosulfidooxidans]